MSSKNMVICDRETEYAKQLGRYFSRNRELALQVKICTSPVQIEAMRKEAEIDLLLIDEEYYSSEKLTGISKVVLLSETRNTNGHGKALRIFRYQSGSDIYTRLVEILAEDSADEFWNIRRKTAGKMIGIYSPVHRTGQTVFALEKGRELAKKSNVLYINLETYAGIGSYFPEEEKRNLSVLLYYAKQRTGDPGLLLTTIVRQMDGLDLIPPVAFSEDLKAVTEAEWLWLFREIMDHTIYDVLILDLGDCIRGLFEILRNCDTVYMPTADDRLAVSKICQYERALCRQGYEDVWERVIRCDIRRAAEDKSSGTDGSVQGGER